MQHLANMKILVVEDERAVRMLLRVVFEASGATVIEAEDGTRALRLLALHPDIDAVCTDIHMPNMNGITLAQHLRDQFPDLPVFACTAFDLDAAEPLQRNLFSGFVHKPFVPADLVRMVSINTNGPNDTQVIAV